MEELLTDFKGKLEQELKLNLSEGVKFDGKFSTTKNGNLDLSELREDIKKHFQVKSAKSIQGIYKIYINDSLFYIGMSKSSIFSRIKRHYSKYEKSVLTNSPKRYTFFDKLVNTENKVMIEIIRMQGKELNYILLIEELLTLSEKPMYKDNINNEIKVNKDTSLDS